MKIKILLYNILNGFCNDNPPYKINYNRMQKAIKIIKKQNPDILILTEAYFYPFAKKANLKNLEKDFRELYNENSKLAYTFFRVAPIILSKYPVKKFDTSMSKYQLNHMRTSIQINKKPLTINVFHPHPDISEKDKAEFLKSILKDGGSNYVLAGDFNSLSSEDNYDAEKLIRGYESFMKEKGEAKVKDMLKCLAVKEVLANNLIDTYKTKDSEYTMPTNLRSKNKDSAIRIDYIFCSKNFKIVGSGIIKDRLTETASDHYPVYAVLETK